MAVCATGTWSACVHTECIDENGGADAIRVIVCNPKSVLPVLSAVVNMPISEQLIKDE